MIYKQGNDILFSIKGISVVSIDSKCGNRTIFEKGNSINLAKNSNTQTLCYCDFDLIQHIAYRNYVKFE